MALSKLVVVCITLPLLAACTESGTLKVESRLGQRSMALAAPASASLELGGGKLVVSSARIKVSEIEFEGGDEDDEREAELGGATIDLALDGTPTAVAGNSVEAGSYHTVGLELRAGSDTIVVEGAFDGRAFTFSSGLNPELEFPLNPEVDVPADGEARVGVTFDVADWFTASDGSVLDPSDGANRGAIETNIMASMAAHAEVETSDSD